MLTSQSASARRRPCIVLCAYPFLFILEEALPCRLFLTHLSLFSLRFSYLYTSNAASNVPLTNAYTRKKIVFRALCIRKIFFVLIKNISSSKAYLLTTGTCVTI